MANMSKELTAIIVTAIAILGFLWNISTQIGSIQKQLGDVQGQIGSLESAVESNTQSIAGLREDVREIRSIVNSHLESHAKQAMLNVSDVGQ